MFGTLCAIDPQAQNPELVQDTSLIQIFGRLLGTILDFFLQAEAAKRREEYLRFISEQDSLTGLYNRRGWEVLLEKEEGRCQQFGFPACVIVFDLDKLKIINDVHGHAAGDRYLMETAKLLQETCREVDLCARVGGYEYMVLLPETSLEQGEKIQQTIQTALETAGIAASMGIAERHPQTGLERAVKVADAAMYHQKKQKHAHL